MKRMIVRKILCAHLDSVFSDFFFFFPAALFDQVNREQCTRALFTDPQIPLFSNFFIKNGSHDTIHIFKNYFATVFSVSVKINLIQTDPITTVIADGAMVLSIEEQKCEHIVNNDVEWVVDSVAPHHIIPMKGLFTMYKVGDFGTVKMCNSSYSKIVGIGDVCALKPMLVVP